MEPKSSRLVIYAVEMGKVNLMHCRYFVHLRKKKHGQSHCDASGFGFHILKHQC